MHQKTKLKICLIKILQLFKHILQDITKYVSPEAQQSHDDFGLKAFELATDLMGDDMAYMTSHFFVYDYLLDNRASSYRRTTTYWQELYAVISGANEVISGLKEQADSGDESVEKMLGQSYTIRAYCYFG